MGQIRLVAGLFVAVCAFGADTPLDSLLKGVEQRYNKAKTLQVLFKEVFIPLGKPRRTESGILMLRKPGKMRWQYAQPPGKLFTSDGKWIWLYTPQNNQAEHMKFKETDDLRAPLAFLLGKLDFNKEFRNLQGTPEGGGMRVTAEPKTDNLPYSAVEFLLGPDTTIREVKVKTFDNAILHFFFEQERMNPELKNDLFDFKPPKGVEVIEAQ